MGSQQEPRFGVHNIPKPDVLPRDGQHGFVSKPNVTHVRLEVLGTVYGYLTETSYPAIDATVRRTIMELLSQPCSDVIQ